MKQLLYDITSALEREPDLCLGTIMSTRGSTPQIPGASALFTSKGLLTGTLGGGVMEGDATQRAKEALEQGTTCTYTFELNADIREATGAICGGSATLLLDSDPHNSKEVFAQVLKDLDEGMGGILFTRISGKDNVTIEREWIKENNPPPVHWNIPRETIDKCRNTDEAICYGASPEESLLLQRIEPREELIITGAGHIGKALSHLGRRLDFKVRVIDSRPEYADASLLPDAHQVQAMDPGEALDGIKLNKRSYVVIVTRGHHEDAAALKACIGSDAAYVGMIGSRKKIRKMREEFLKQGWATAGQFNRVHAPVGLEIGAETVEEIALSISAQLVQVRRLKNQRSHVSGIILAAGSSIRMGQPKMLLPFGDQSILGKVLSECSSSMLDDCSVVLGAHKEKITATLDTNSVRTVFNPAHESGMLSSIQCGVNSLSEQSDGMLMMLGDQPLVDAATIDRVVQAFKRSSKHIFIATYQDKRGHPVLISRQLFKKILDIPKEHSLRDLFAQHPDDIEEVACDNPDILVDIDTPEEYENQLKKINK